MQRALVSIAALGVLAAHAGCTGGDQVFPAESESAGAGGSGGFITGAGGSSSTSNSDTSASTGAGAGSSVGGGSSTGGGGSGPTCPPAGPFVGAPITGTPHQWKWIPIPGAKCRDGSDTGFGIRTNPASTKLFIYLEGGGACFNAATCAISLASFAQFAFDGWKGTAGAIGLFDDKLAENPFQDWNAVYVPYCTGDVHAGDADFVDVPGGPADQHFVGYANIGLFLQRLVPTFPDATHVVITGVSAGGFGAAFNYDRLASAFCPTPVTLLDDSGPPMSDAYLAPCLQTLWRDLWNLDATLPADCAACSSPGGGGIVNYASYLAAKWPQGRMGLISSTHDSVISTFFGYGANDCTGMLPLSGAEYEAGLEDLKANYLSSSALWGTYFVNSVTHTYLELPTFYTTQVQNQKLTSWVTQLLYGQPTNVGP